MDIIGRSTIHPLIFYTGKVAGYAIWIMFFLGILDIGLFEESFYTYLHFISYFTALFGVLLIVFSSIKLGSSIRLGLPHEDTVLKTAGIYRFSRNPMYVGFNLLTIAGMIYFFNFMITLLGLYSLVTYHLIILGEERFLSKRFGEKFEQYKLKTRRYL